MPLVVVYRDVESLTPAHRNPKQHDIGAILQSMARFGFGEPGLLDERTGRLVAGHGRLEALHALRIAGEDPPDGVEIAPDGHWCMPVVEGWRSTDDDEAEAMGVALNRITERGGWDEAELADILGEWARRDTELVEASGWSVEEVEALVYRTRAGDSEPPPEEPEEGAEEPIEASSGTRMLTVMLATSEYREVLTALDGVAARYGLDSQGAALARLCRLWAAGKVNP